MEERFNAPDILREILDVLHNHQILFEHMRNEITQTLAKGLSSQDNR